MKSPYLKTLLSILISIAIIAIVTRPFSPAIDVKDTTLNQFTDSQINTLLRHLASSANWQLKQYQGVWRAIRRQEICGTYQMSFNNSYYSSSSPDSPRSQVLIIFQPYESGSFGIKQHITTVKAGEKSPRLRLRVYSGDIMSDLVISNPNFFLYVFEDSPNWERKLTQEAFYTISNEFSIVLSKEKEILEKGYTTTAIPNISVIHSDEPSFVVSNEASCSENSWSNDLSCEVTGHCQVSGHINPGEFGYTYVKVFDIQNDKQLCSEDIQNRSMEYIGWSSNPSDQFFYDANITICGGSLSKQLARFELWFQPINGEARKLLETTHLVSSWER